MGRQDDVVGHVDQVRLIEHYPRTTVAVLDAAGRGLQYEQQALFEAHPEDWLDRVERAG